MVRAHVADGAIWHLAANSQLETERYYMNAKQRKWKQQLHGAIVDHGQANASEEHVGEVIGKLLQRRRDELHHGQHCRPRPNRSNTHTTASIP